MAVVICALGVTYICYVDEAGCTTPLAAARTDVQPVLAIVGLVLSVDRLRAVTLEFLALKRQFFPGKFKPVDHPLDDVLVEIKGSDLRSNIRKHGAAADASLKFLDRTLDLLRENDARLFASMLIKGIGEPIDSRALYTSSIQAACRNFCAFLAERADSGLMVADFRNPGLNSQVAHSIFTQKYRAKGDPMRGLLELPTFGHSNNHIPLQIADLLCSALLFPMATATYCDGRVVGKHVRGRDKLIKRRYARRIKALQFQYREGEGGATRGGIYVSNRLDERGSAHLFQFPAFTGGGV